MCVWGGGGGYACVCVLFTHVRACTHVAMTLKIHILFVNEWAFAECSGACSAAAAWVNINCVEFCCKCSWHHGLTRCISSSLLAAKPSFTERGNDVLGRHSDSA